MTCSLILTCLLSVPAVAPPANLGPTVIEGKTLTEWLAVLRTSPGDKWEDAAQSLREFGPRAVDALPALLADLKRSDEDACGRRVIVLNTIAAIGPAAKSAVPAMVNLVRRAGPRDSVRALDVLAAIGENATGAVPELLKSFDSDRYHSLYRHKLALALAGIAPADKAVRLRLRRALRDEDEEMRVHAAWALWRLRDPELDVIKMLERAKSSKESDVRYALAEWLGEMAPSKSEACTALLLLLTDPDEHVRRKVVEALDKLRPKGTAAVRAYCRALGTKHWYIRCSAAEWLGEMKESAKPAVKDLEAVLGDENGMVRSAAGFALWEIDSVHCKVALEVLGHALKDESPNTRCHAIKRLGRMGREARTALPQVRKLLQDEWPDVRNEAARALVMIDRPSP